MSQIFLLEYFFENSLGFFIFYFTTGNSTQNKASLLEIPQNFVISLENSRAKNQDLGNSTLFFCIFPWSPLEEILHAISLIPLEIKYFLPPPCLFFLWGGGGGIAHYSCKVHYIARVTSFESISAFALLVVFLLPS